MTNFLELFKNNPESLVGRRIIGPFGNSGILQIESIGKIPGNTKEIKLGLVDCESNQFIRLNIPLDQLKNIEFVKEFNFTGNPEKFFMYMMGNAIRSNFNQDPLFAVGSSKIDPLPHQLEAVYKYILPRYRIRFMIADEPGAGKTIMAGLVIKELISRGDVKRILVVVPGSLTGQWQMELKNRFNEDFTIIDSELLRSIGTQTWTRFNKIITSMDFAKNEVQTKKQKGKREIRNSLIGVHWDLVIVDEAHKMNAEWDKRKMVMKSTKRYRLGEKLSEYAENILFLTATPHKGKSDSFRLLLKLIDPDPFDDNTADIKSILEHFKEEGYPIFIRRLKEEMVTADRKPIFPSRQAQTILFTLSPLESILYTQVTQYVKKIFNLAKEAGGKRSNSIGFMLKILQRRLNSSIRAIRLTLFNRKKRLQEILDNPDFDKSLRELQVQIEKLTLEVAEAEMDDDIPPKKVEDLYKQISYLTMASNREELEKEVNHLKELVKYAEDAEQEQIESKLNALLKEIDHSLGEQQLIIFTEYKDTLDYLMKRIPNSFSKDHIHGGMTGDQRKKVQERFWSKNIQILLCTDAASEGINLQCCWNLFNYDIPWNPNRLEQRMGRIHRYLQDHPCTFFNLVASETADGEPIAEGQVLKRIFEKLDIMRDELGGTDRVFDVIGQIFEDTDFEQLLLEALNQDEIDFDALIPQESSQKISDLLKEKSNVDIGLEFFIKQRQKSEDNRLWPQYISEFVHLGYWYQGKSVQFDGSEPYKVEIPIKIRWQMKQNESKYGTISGRFLDIVFNKPNERQLMNQVGDVEYITAGHPLLESIIDLSVKNGAESIQKGTIFLDPSHGLHGLLWFLDISFTDGTGVKDISKQVLVLYSPFAEIAADQFKDIQYKILSPLVLWDLRRDYNSASQIDIQPYKLFFSNFRQYIVEGIGGKLCQETETELSEFRAKAKNLKLDVLDKKEIRKKVRLEQQISKLYDKEDAGEDITQKLEEKFAERDMIPIRIVELKKQIETQCKVLRQSPNLLSAAIVIPAYSDGKPAQNLEEASELVDKYAIDRASMRAVIEFEQNRGWITTDKSLIKCGYDIESINSVDTTEIRHIEVKGHKEEDDIFISKNEWLKAQNDVTGRYWLYIVNNALDKPEVIPIEDPASKFIPEKIITERFKISLKEIKNYSKNVK